MTRIDRYLLILYVRILVICFCTVAGLLIVIHMFGNLDEFLKFSEVDGSGLVGIVVEYYGPYILMIFDQLSAMLALLALLFVIAWLNKTNELTALLATGINKRRIIRPLLVASVAVILSAAVIREFGVPRYQDQLDRNPQDLTGELPRPIRTTFDPGLVVLMKGNHLLPTNRQIVLPKLKVFRGPLLERMGSKLIADYATYMEADEQHPAGYLYTDVSVPAGIDQVDSLSGLDGSPIILTAKDTTWIPTGACFLASKIEFETLRGGTMWKQFASTTELVQYLRGEQVRSANEMRVHIHQRILRPAIDWTVLLLGMPVLLTRPDRHMFWVAGACLGIVAGFTLVAIGFSQLGRSGYFLSPALAVWMPLLLFFPWAYAKTEQAMES